MNKLHDRINRVINTTAFEASLVDAGIDLIEFQLSWKELSTGEFDKLPEAYKQAIIAGEQELEKVGEMVLA